MATREQRQVFQFLYEERTILRSVTSDLLNIISVMDAQGEELQEEIVFS
jgi:hypothetical protein